MMAFTVALAACVHAVGTGRSKPILPGLDGAGWHVSPQLQVLEGVHRHCLPPYLPGLQQAERSWPLTQEALANRHCQDVEALQTAQAHRCLSLQCRR